MTITFHYHDFTLSWKLIIENTCNTNTLSRDTIYLFLIYIHPRKKNLIPPQYSYLYANVIFKTR